MPDLQDVEPWPEPVDGRVLLDELKAWLVLFVVLPKWAAEILALWILHTFAFLLRDTSTYIGLESPIRRCGKTTLMSVLHDLVNRPLASSNVSSSSLFHAIDELRPTFFIDEGDMLLPGKTEVRGILNAGYKTKMSYVLRVANQKADRVQRQSVGASERENCANQEGDASAKKVGGKRSRLISYSCFCPKIMAQIGRLPDTLADRCIIVRMQRKTPDVKCERLKKIDGTRLKRQCARFIQDHAAEIASASPEIPAVLNDRMADICEPLIVLADLAGGPWPELARQAMVGLSESAQANDPIETLLLDIQLIFTNMGVERAFSRTIVAALNRLTGRPWSEMRRGPPSQSYSAARKKINDQWLGRQLQPYEIASKTLRIGKELAKGYLATDFREALQRYFTRTQFDQKSEVRDQKSEAQDAEGGGEEKSDSPSADSHLHDVSERQAGATSPPSPSDSGAATDGENRKDEPGGTEGGEAEAAA